MIPASNGPFGGRIMKVDRVLQALAERLKSSHGADDYAFDHDAEAGTWRFWIIDSNVEIHALSRIHLMDQMKDAIRCCHA